MLMVLCMYLTNDRIHAQNFLGLATQAHGELYSAYQNPALLTRNQNAIQVHILSGVVNLNNNYVRYAAPFSMLELIQGKNSRPLDTYDLEEIRNDKPRNANLTAELRGPALAMRVGSKTTLALMSKVRSGFQVTDASTRLMAIARLGLTDADNLQDLGYLALYASQLENRFNLSSIAYSEWAFSVGQVLIETDHYRLSGGLTAKRYFGYVGGYVKNKVLNYRIIPDPTTRNGAYMQIDHFEATMGYTDLNKRSFISPGWLFGQNKNGSGWGIDAGLTYEIIKENEGIAPMRFSASITDLGQIKYNGGSVRNYSINTDVGKITEEEWRSYTSPQDGENQFSAVGRLLEDEFGLKDENNTGQFNIAPSTALNLSVDIPLASNFYLNSTIIQGIKRSSLPQLRQIPLWALVPRFETTHFGFAFPIIRQNSTWAIGTGLRLGPVRVGSDNLLGLFSKNGNFKAQGVDVYAGLSLGFGNKNFPGKNK